jgi:ankyrin repeat protein
MFKGSVAMLPLARKFPLLIGAVSCALLCLYASAAGAVGYSEDTDAFLLEVAIDTGNIVALQERLGVINANARDDHGEMALTRAVRDGHLEAVRLLLAAGARSDRRTSGGMTLLGLAVLNGDAAIVRALVESGADIDARSASRERPLTLALSTARNDIVSFLLDHGARTDVTDAHGSSALELAARYADDAVFARLQQVVSADARSR